jgi:hypothetical protein
MNRGAHPAPRGIAQQVGSRLGGLTVAIGQAAAPVSPARSLEPLGEGFIGWRACRGARKPVRTRATRCGAFTMRQWSWAAWMSSNAIASPAAREPGPLVTLLRCRTPHGSEQSPFR